MKVKLDEMEKEEICQGRGKIRQKIETKGMMGESLEFWLKEKWMKAEKERKKSEGGRDRPYAETPPQLEFEHFVCKKNKQTTNNTPKSALTYFYRSYLLMRMLSVALWSLLDGGFVEPTELWWGWIDEIFGGGLERGCRGDGRCSDKDNSPRVSVPKEKCRLWGWQAAPIQA